MDPVLEIPVLLAHFKSQLKIFTIVAFAPVNSNKKAEFVCNLIPVMLAVPENEAEHFPIIVTGPFWESVL